MPTGVGWEDARALLWMNNEARRLGVGTRPCRAFLLGELARLVRAGHAIFALDPVLARGGRGPLAHLTVHGEGGLALVEPLTALGRSGHPLIEALRVDPRLVEPVVRTLRRSEVLADPDGQGSPHVERVLTGAGVDDWMLSVRTGEAATPSWIAMVRARGAPRFSQADADVLHLFHGACAELLLPPSVDPGELSLPPRMRETLGCLMTGATDKEIAVDLGISLHTAREYVKKLLSAYGASSRAQLIASLARRSPAHSAVH